MENNKLFFALCVLLLYHIEGSQGVLPEADEHYRPTKLFVFGDSYADTGNDKKTSNGWKVPYGITFPGKPSGRYSDGRVITDYLATFLGLKTPIAYMLRKHAVEELKYGTNFAYSGTGVFETLNPGPNMTTQIDFFQNLLNEYPNIKQDLKTSLVLVTLSGNDYSAYISRGGSVKDMSKFISLVVNQLAVNLKRIGDMGVRKVVVAAIEPLGCLPAITAFYSYIQCDTTTNTAALLHNSLLQQAVSKLSNETKGSTYVMLDVYNSFLEVIEKKGHPSTAETPLKPCCMGINSTYSCGSIDKSGNKLYMVCSAPESALFWDNVHPSNAGWSAVFLLLKSGLRILTT